MIGRIINRIKSVFRLPAPEKSGWSGDYKTWGEAMKESTGYDQGVILSKIKESILKVKNGKAEYERDSVAFDTFEYSEDFLNALKLVVQDNSLSVVDFGGSLGSQYFQYRRFFGTSKINWMVVEQSHFADCGNREIADDSLSFFYSIEDALKYKKADTIILSSVLPYIEHPFALIEKVVSFGFQYIIIDRNPFIDAEKDLLTVQVVPDFIYKASYPAWFFNEDKFKRHFTKNYEINSVFDSPFSAPMVVNGKNAVWKGLILVKK